MYIVASTTYVAHTHNTTMRKRNEVKQEPVQKEPVKKEIVKKAVKKLEKQKTEDRIKSSLKVGDLII